MNKIVTTGMKIDLHIHSQFSSLKDGSKVKNNTIENIPLLVNKLNQNGVNICAITDHDNFSYKIYSALKSAESESNSIKKVLPGVEFSVEFSAEGVTRDIHVIAVFSDSNDSKTKKIESILSKKKPINGLAYNEEEFLDILRTIDIDTILIAHQKNSLTSQKPRKNDANCLGQDKFLEFVYTDYFEAYEFKNKRNEVLNKEFMIASNLEDSIRFITGTDCHEWNYYPSEDAMDMSIDFPYTYAKCLPTFKGLVMAITDHRRLKTENSFFNVDKKCIENILVKISDCTMNIALSKGINVIIGDNSIGKSMLLHEMTKYSKKGQQLSSSIRNGYKKYLKSNNFEIMTTIPSEDVFCFDMQGEVRAKFEENKLSSAEFLGDYFPPKVDSKPYRNIVESEIKRLLDYLQEKFKLDAQKNQLLPHVIPIMERNAESLTFISNLRRSKMKTQQLNDIISKFNEVIGSIRELTKLPLDSDDIEFISDSIKKYLVIKEKYDTRLKIVEKENERIEKVAKVIVNLSEKHRRRVSDNQKKYSASAEATASLTQQLIDIIRKEREVPLYEPHIDVVSISPIFNKIFDYEFISKLNIEKIDTEYLISIIKSMLRINKNIDWKNIKEDQLKSMLLRYDNETPVLEFFYMKLKDKLEEDFANKNSIIYQGMDKYAEMSSGLDAKIYFDLLAYESNKKGIYIIDQPEDNISQSAIKTYLLERFKTMGENRQIIMITHNPQFIVNLDVDNLIYITKKSGNIQIQSGALEYSCDDYDILDIIVQNIDGGLETIQKRWKRYEKAANI